MSEAVVHPPQVEQVGIGDMIRIDGVMFKVDQIESGNRLQTALVSSEIYENQRRRRPIDRHMDLTVEEHMKGDLIREEWSLVRLKGKTLQWNVFIYCKITKESE